MWNPALVPLGASNIKKYLAARTKMMLVLFYADSNKPSVEISSEWNTMPTRMAAMMEVGIIDAAKDKAIAAEYGVTKLPAVQLFTYDHQLPPAVYEGEMDMNKIVEWALAYIPSKYVTILLPHHWVGFSQQLGAKIVLFSEKTVPSPLFRALSMQFRERVHFGMIRKWETALVQQLGATQFPSILVVTSDGKQFFYQKEMKFDDLQKLISKYASKTPLPPPTTKKREVIELTRDNYASTCEKQMCMLLLANSRDDVEGAKRALGEMAAKYKTATMGFGVIARGEAATFAAGKVLNKLLPADGVLLIKSQRQRFAALPLTPEEGEWPLDTMSLYLSSALSGDISWSALPSS